MSRREKVDEIAGRICEAIIPVRGEYHLGRGNSIAICTLSSLDLLKKISATPSLMDRVAIVGRLLSENRGIDTMIRFAMNHPQLELLVLCGKEVKGHLAGQALLALARHGVDSSGRIIGALGPYPTLREAPHAVNAFRARIRIVDRVGTTDIERIGELIA